MTIGSLGPPGERYGDLCEQVVGPEEEARRALGGVSGPLFCRDHDFSWTVHLFATKHGLVLAGEGQGRISL